MDEGSAGKRREPVGRPEFPRARASRAGRRAPTRVQSARCSELGQHAREYLQSQVFLVAQPVCASLDDTNFIVQTFHESKRDLVLWLAVGSDPIPMSINHLSEFLVGFQALPLQARAPVLDESP